MRKRNIATLAAIGLLLLSRAFADNPPDFQPDVQFEGSSLKGWHILGDAKWQAIGGEFIGTPTAGGSGGWLVLDKSYQDIQLTASFRCEAGCKTGILFRAQKTAEGIKGVYYSLTEGDLGAYTLTLDAQGKELERDKLATAAGLRTLVAYPEENPNAQAAAAGDRPQTSNAEQAAGAGRGAGGRGGFRGRGGSAPAVKADDWNTFHAILDMEVLRPQLNASAGGFGGLGASDTGDYGAGFGPIALYVGGTGVVHFKDVAYKGISAKNEPSEYVSPNYRIQRISDFDYAWSAAVADVNHDGIKDVIAGPYYYLGPKYTERHEIYRAVTNNPGSEYPMDMVDFAFDYSGDGWPDVLSTNFRPISIFINPKGESRRWVGSLVVPQVTSELALFKDIDGDGKPEVEYGGATGYAYAKPDPSELTKPWTVHQISDPSVRANNHGMGVGDINGDGRADFLTPTGWYEQPPAGSTGPWPFHPEDFGSGGAEMCVYDVNGDGLPDVVTSLAAHGFGLAWFEQQKDKNGNISFVKHMIMGDYSTKNAGDVTFSQLHAMACADMDGDGVPDVVTGKRYWAHLDGYGDADPYGPAVLYVYHTIRDPKAPGGARFMPELIHNRSGVGSTVAVADLKGDGGMDIITSTNSGTFIFWGKPHKKWPPGTSSLRPAQNPTASSGRGR